jgi:hypothetical protein
MNEHSNFNSVSQQVVLSRAEFDPRLGHVGFLVYKMIL